MVSYIFKDFSTGPNFQIPYVLQYGLLTSTPSSLTFMDKCLIGNPYFCQIPAGSSKSNLSNIRANTWIDILGCLTKLVRFNSLPLWLKKLLQVDPKNKWKFNRRIFLSDYLPRSQGSFSFTNVFRPHPSTSKANLRACNRRLIAFGTVCFP